MKKFTDILVAFLVASTMFFGVAAGAKTAGKVSVGLSTDEGGLNDKSFNQAADNGVKKAVKEFGLESFNMVKKFSWQNLIKSMLEKYQ